MALKQFLQLYTTLTIWHLRKLNPKILTKETTTTTTRKKHLCGFYFLNILKFKEY